MKPFPDSHPEPYDFSQWELGYFKHAGEFMTRLVAQKDTTNMRQAILNLYFQEGQETIPAD